MNIAKISFNNSIYNYLGMFFSMVFSILTTRYILNYLSVEEFGMYNIILIPIMILSPFLALGVPSAMLRFIPELREKNKLIIAKIILRRSIFNIFKWSIVLMSVLIFFRSPINKFLGLQPNSCLFLIIILIGAFRALVDIFANTIDAQFKHGLRNLLNVSVSFLKLILFLILLKMGSGVWKLILAGGAIDILLLSSYGIKLWHFKEKEGKSGFDIKYESNFLKRFFKFRVKEYFCKPFAVFWSLWIDVLILKYFFGDYTAGLFSFAVTLVFYVFNWNPGIAIQSIIRPLFARQYTKDNSQKQLEFIFGLYNKFCVFFALPSFVFVAIYADLIIKYVFDIKYLSSVNIVICLMPFIFLQMMLHPIRNILVNIEKNEIIAYSNIFIVYKLILSFVLIKSFGAVGAIIAYSSTVLLIFLFQFFFARKYIYLNYSWRSFFRIAVNTLVSSTFLFVLRKFVINIYFLILALLLTGVIYLICSVKNKVFNEEESSIFNKAFPIPLWRF